MWPTDGVRFAIAMLFLGKKTTNYLNKKCAIQIGNQAAMPQGPAIELSNKNTSGFQRLTIYMHWAVI